MASPHSDYGIVRDPRTFGYNPVKETLLGFLRRLSGTRIPRPGLLRHIDYSIYNAGDMAALYEGGVTIAHFRVSMGVNGIDQEGRAQALAFKQAGGVPLLYHLFLDYSGEQQAAHFLNVVDPLLVTMDGKGLVSLDQETPMSNRRARSEAFCATVRGRTDLKTGLYTNNNYANTWGLKGAWIKPAFDFTWQAHWTAGNPTQIDGWYQYAHPEEKKRCFHQSGIYNDYWWEDPVAGITSDIDIDWYYGTQADLQNILGMTPAPTIEERVSALEAMAHSH